MNHYTELRNALQVFTLDKKILSFLKANDPQALKQAREALKRTRPLPLAKQKAHTDKIVHRLNSMTMRKIVADAERYAKQTGAALLDHCDICNMLARDYGLYEKNQFPLWLSRVVEGCMRDVGRTDI